VDKLAISWVKRGFIIDIFENDDLDREPQEPAV
jgi:hypothetical protein